MKTKTTNNPLIMDVIARIAQERCRQNALVAEGKFKWNCSTMNIADSLKLAVLMEEVGEVAKEICEADGLTALVSRKRMQTELVQVAAVAVAWLEGLELADRNVRAPRSRKLPPLTEEQIDTVLHGRSA